MLQHEHNLYNNLCTGKFKREAELKYELNFFFVSSLKMIYLRLTLISLQKKKGNRTQ